jgi:hypothetical protein
MGEKAAAGAIAFLKHSGLIVDTGKTKKPRRSSERIARTEKMDAFAHRIERADRFNDKFNRKNNFFALDPALEKDQRAYTKYRELSRRLDNYTAREIRAARHHDFEELLRLFALEKKTRNQRTAVTADMGLRFCGV